MKTILITGAAGFIGQATAKVLLKRGDRVIGIDNLNPYYDPNLKKARLKILKGYKRFTFHKGDISDYKAIEKAIKGKKIDCILHLAAQAGVRYSIDHPFLYEESNLKATLNLLEIARHHKIKDFVFSSSSSVYGGITEFPFREEMKIDKPVSLYAATKGAGELMCHAYHRLYGTNFRCLRFFTVYGPWGRPDMALFTFTGKILKGDPIDVYNKGEMYRDFTYIDDIVQGVVASIDSGHGFEIFNLARGRSEKLLRYIEVLEGCLGKKAKKRMLPMQKGDVEKTDADISKARKMLRYHPKTSIEEGVRNFVEWYKEYYKA